MTRYAFLFPGQGSQYVGMTKKLCEAFPVAKELLETLDETLKQPLSRLMMEGPIEELTLTKNTQPALMAHSMAIMSILEKEVGFHIANSVHYVAGHSLGEYSALCATQAFDFVTTARLLRARGEAMQNAVPSGVGGMAAILGTTISQVKQICEQVSTSSSIAVVANDNGAGQVVISGHQDAIERAIDLATSMGIKRAVKLTVSAPFHSPLMKPAAEKMQEVLQTVDVQSPIVPVVANVTANLYENNKQIKPLLVEQVCSPVRWAETMSFLFEKNIEVFFEIGAGKVLSNLLKRETKDKKVYSIGEPADIDQFVKLFA